MKYLILVFMISMFCCGSTRAQESTDSYTLTVNFTGLQNSDGLVKVALCSKKENWLSDKVMTAEGTISNGVSTINFEIPATGEYAISTFHDENSNDEMDSNAFGIPKEDYAFSNDAKGFFGPASFDDAKFEVTGDMEIIIKF